MAVTTFKATSRRLPYGSAVESRVRGFRVLVDAPKSLGGTDTGMHPVELLLCALGSCQCNAVKAFAEANGIELKDLWLELEGDLDRDGLLDITAGGGSQTQHMHLIFHMRSDAPQDVIERLKTFVAQRWPEGDTLFNGVRIASSDIVVEPSQRFT